MCDKMPPRPANLTTRTDDSGSRKDEPMNKRAEDVVRRTSAAAHADQPGTDREHAESGRWSKTRRTLNNWKREGPPQLRAAQTYLLNCPESFRGLATLVSAQKQGHIKTLSTPELKARYRELLPRDKRAEAKDTADDLDPSVGWLDRALSSEKDGANDLEKGAIEREFAVRGVSVDEILGGER